MMITVAFDSFKGSVDGYSASCYVAGSLRELGIDARAYPLADGGEGTSRALSLLSGGRRFTVCAEDAYGNPVEAECHDLGDGVVAADLASCCGLGSAEGTGRARVMEASSYGVGILMRHIALLPATRRILLGLGGSASCDGGLGLLQALGATFRLEGTMPRRLAGKDLTAVEDIDLTTVLPLPPVTVLRDVSAPLTGAEGAARRFASQKGADAEQVEILEAGMKHWCSVVAAHLDTDAARLCPLPGMGAAGGISLAAHLLHWRLSDGAAYVAGRLMERMRGTHLVITGEGRTDAGTLLGKAPYALMRLAANAGIPTLLLSGAITLADADLRRAGFRNWKAVTPQPFSHADLDPDLTMRRLAHAAIQELLPAAPRYK